MPLYLKQQTNGSSLKINIDIYVTYLLQRCSFNQFSFNFDSKMFSMLRSFVTFVLMQHFWYVDGKCCHICNLFIYHSMYVYIAFNIFENRS